MKRIYTFELDDDYASRDDSINIKSDVSIIAYLLCSKIMELEDQRGTKILALDDFLHENEMLDVMNVNYSGKETYSYSKYKFDYSQDESNIMFDPIMFSERNFGITVYEGTINGGTMQYLIEYITEFLKKDYCFDIRYIDYECGTKRSEELKRRKMAIQRLLYKYQPKESFRKKVRTPVFKKRIV